MQVQKMVKGRGKSKKSVPVKEDIAQLEKEAIAKAKVALAAMERFLSKHDSSASKPERMRYDVQRIKGMHSELKAWKKEAERGKRDEGQKAGIISRFIRICWKYS